MAEFIAELKSLWLRDLKHPHLTNWEKTKRRWARELKIMPKSSDLARAYEELVLMKKIDGNRQVLESLRIKKVRTQSGVAPFAVMMKPFPCPGRCVYCVEEKGMPKSYMADEPASARALEHNFDPIKQVESRLKHLKLTGHRPQKIQIIVVGGTFSAYENNYKISFIKNIFDACNGFIAKDIHEAQEANEKSVHRIVGLSIETRPDWISDEEIQLLRMCGVTKVQLGVQSLSEEINLKSARGHDLEAVIRATRQLRNAGFKINYHFMLNLPGSSPQKDVEMLKELFSNNNYKPDSIKIYPCVVIPNTPLFNLFSKGLYQSYEPDVLVDTMIQCKMMVPKYCRIDRLARDITKKYTASGNRRTNLRDLVQKKMSEENLHCQCIRCREIKEKYINLDDTILTTHKYEASQGNEYLITIEKSNFLIALLRLRVPHEQDLKNLLFPALSHASLIRELQVFGKQAPLSDSSTGTIQHRSFGAQLMREAERLTKSLGINKIAVIAGVGVRPYYKKLGYTMESTYMVKYLG